MSYRMLGKPNPPPTPPPPPSLVEAVLKTTLDDWSFSVEEGRLKVSSRKGSNCTFIVGVLSLSLDMGIGIPDIEIKGKARRPIRRYLKKLYKKHLEVKRILEEQRESRVVLDAARILSSPKK